MNPPIPSLQFLDWLVIVGYLFLTIGLGLYFTRRAGRSMDAFFVSGRSLPWYLAGVSMIATSFASDTPLWISSLVRQYGIYYIWQYWAPAIGSALAIVLFARLWRRMGVLTDIEFLELRYSGRAAAWVRGWSGFTQALLFCPLIISWVTKAMETITREAMGLPPEYRLWTTIVVVGVALVSCALSGLWGVVYTDLFQFILATVGTIILASLAVRAVGGLEMMVERLTALEEWSGSELLIRPSVGAAGNQMSVWNAIGYFGILWISVALAGGYQAQRVLACRDSRHASLAMLLHTMLYYAVICWPWIIVALCSILLIPNLGEGVSHDAAYPRMIVSLMPTGLRGVMIVALLAAFMSTISTLFNWGSSYIVNDLYKRFLVREASSRHYVMVGRAATFFMAAMGAVISLYARDIQQLLTISYVVGSSITLVGLMRWFWWRLNAWGELAGAVSGWTLAGLLLFARIFDAPARYLFGPESNLSSDSDLLGARMMTVMLVVAVVAVVVSLLTPPTEADRLEQFVRRARPFHFFWKPIIRRFTEPGYETESLSRTLVSWGAAVLAVYSLMFGIGKVLLGQAVVGGAALLVFGIALWVTVRRISQDFEHELVPVPEAVSAPED